MCTDLWLKTWSMYPLQNSYKYIWHFRWRPQTVLRLKGCAHKKFQRSQTDWTKHQRFGCAKETSQMFRMTLKTLLTGWWFEYSYSCSTPSHLENTTMSAVKTRSYSAEGLCDLLWVYPRIQSGKKDGKTILPTSSLVNLYPSIHRG